MDFGSKILPWGRNNKLGSGILILHVVAHQKRQFLDISKSFQIVENNFAAGLQIKQYMHVIGFDL